MMRVAGREPEKENKEKLFLLDSEAVDKLMSSLDIPMESQEQMSVAQQEVADQCHTK